MCSAEHPILVIKICDNISHKIFEIYLIYQQNLKVINDQLKGFYGNDGFGVKTKYYVRSNFCCDLKVSDVCFEILQLRSETAFGS